MSSKTISFLSQKRQIVLQITFLKIKKSMKKIIKMTIIILSSFNFNYAQDVISLKKGGEIKTKVVEIDKEYIKYKRFDNLNGPTIWVLKADVNLITYENGTKEIIEFSESPNESATIPPIVSSNSGNLYIDGQTDATFSYTGKKSGATGTLIVSLISPIVGLIPAIATSASTPLVENLNSPKPELLRDQNYLKGYNYKAKRIKQGKVWTNWGVAFGLNLLAVLVLNNSN